MLGVRGLEFRGLGFRAMRLGFWVVLVLISLYYCREVLVLVGVGSTAYP